MPGLDASLSPQKPSYFLIFGNGFTLSEDQARLIIAAWVKKRKNILGESASVGVKYILKSFHQTNRDFLKQCVKYIIINSIVCIVISSNNH